MVRQEHPESERQQLAAVSDIMLIPGVISHQLSDLRFQSTDYWKSFPTPTLQ